MKTIAYMNDGVLVTEAFPTDDVRVDFEHIDITGLQIEYFDTCYMEDGQLKIDQQKLIEFNRKRMPILSPIEFDIKLNQNGLYDEVQNLIKDNFELRIAYTRAIFFSRTDPFIEQARIALKLTNEKIDAMWTA